MRQWNQQPINNMNTMVESGQQVHVDSTTLNNFSLGMKEHQTTGF